MKTKVPEYPHPMYGPFEVSYAPEDQKDEIRAINLAQGIVLGWQLAGVDNPQAYAEWQVALAATQAAMKAPKPGKEEDDA